MVLKQSKGQNIIPCTMKVEKVNENGNWENTQSVKEPKLRPDNLSPISESPKVVGHS